MLIFLYLIALPLTRLASDRHGAETSSASPKGCPGSLFIDSKSPQQDANLRARRHRRIVTPTFRMSRKFRGRAWCGASSCASRYTCTRARTLRIQPYSSCRPCPHPPEHFPFKIVPLLITPHNSRSPLQPYPPVAHLHKTPPQQLPMRAAHMEYAYCRWRNPFPCALPTLTCSPPPASRRRLTPVAYPCTFPIVRPCTLPLSDSQPSQSVAHSSTERTGAEAHGHGPSLPARTSSALSHTTLEAGTT